MSLFGFTKNKMRRIVIIGCGRLGALLATTFSENGNTVLIIDSSKTSFQKLSASFGGLSIVGNALYMEVLAQAHIDQNTSVICVTDNDNTNIMVAQMAKALFLADTVIARLYDPEKDCVYQEQNILTICPSTLAHHEIFGLLTEE